MNESWVEELEETKGVLVRGRHGLAGIGLMLADMPLELPFLTGMTFQGMNLTKRGGSWLIVLKASNPSGRKVMFVEGETILVAYRNLWRMLYKGEPRWAADKYAK